MVSSHVLLVSLPLQQKRSRGTVLPFATSAFSEGFVGLSLLLLTTPLLVDSGVSGPIGGVSPPVLRLAPDR